MLGSMVMVLSSHQYQRGVTGRMDEFSMRGRPAGAMVGSTGFLAATDSWLLLAARAQAKLDV